MQNTTSSKFAKFGKVSLGLAACVAATVSAYALVTFDPLTFTGFVGKGDVQTACGGNNSVLQGYAESVTFSYDSSTSYEYECEWYTGPVQNRRRHTVTHKSKTGVNAAVNSDARQARNQHQFTGFNLTGCGATVGGGGAVVAVGDACPGNPGTGAVVISVEAVGSGSGGGLYVNCPAGSPNAGNSVLLQ